MSSGNNQVDRKLKLHVDDEHRMVVLGTPDGIEEMGEEQILALLRRASELRVKYEGAGYTVTHSGPEHPKWRP